MASWGHMIMHFRPEATVHKRVAEWFRAMGASRNEAYFGPALAEHLKVTGFTDDEATEALRFWQMHYFVQVTDDWRVFKLNDAGIAFIYSN